MEYKYINEKLSNGNTIKYKIINDTAYHIDTPDKLVAVLELIKTNHYRVTFDYGDVKTGKSWGETYDITGYIGRSTGKIKIPLLIQKSNSWGGVSILDNCILSIKHSNKKNGGYLYK